MKLYLASKFQRQAEIRGYAAILQELGYIITSKWLWDEPEDALNQPYSGKAIEYANKDISNVSEADMLVVFTHDGPARGGMHVEFGIALALGKPLMVVGPRSTIFHHLPQVMVFETWEKALQYFRAWQL